MSFQKERYIARCKEKNVIPQQHYLEIFDENEKSHNSRFDDPNSRKNNLEYDLLTTQWILDKVRSSFSYSQNLYAALCNNSFIKREFWSILKEETWSCTWRYAGGIIADMRQEGDYIEWYCSGIRDQHEPTEEEMNSWTEKAQLDWTNVYSKYVAEGTVSEEIKNDLYELGWIVSNNE